MKPMTRWKRFWVSTSVVLSMCLGTALIIYWLQTTSQYQLSVAVVILSVAILLVFIYLLYDILPAKGEDDPDE